MILLEVTHTSYLEKSGREETPITSLLIICWRISADIADTTSSDSICSISACTCKWNSLISTTTRKIFREMIHPDLFLTTYLLVGKKLFIHLTFYILSICSCYVISYPGNRNIISHWRVKYKITRMRFLWVKKSCIKLPDLRQFIFPLFSFTVFMAFDVTKYTFNSSFNSYNKILSPDWWKLGIYENICFMIHYITIGLIHLIKIKSSQLPMSS